MPRPAAPPHSQERGIFSAFLAEKLPESPRTFEQSECALAAHLFAPGSGSTWKPRERLTSKSRKVVSGQPASRRALMIASGRGPEVPINLLCDSELSPYRLITPGQDGRLPRSGG